MPIKWSPTVSAPSCTGWSRALSGVLKYQDDTHVLVIFKNKNSAIFWRNCFLKWLTQTILQLSSSSRINVYFAKFLFSVNANEWSRWMMSLVNNLLRRVKITRQMAPLVLHSSATYQCNYQLGVSLWMCGCSFSLKHAKFVVFNNNHIVYTAGMVVFSSDYCKTSIISEHQTFAIWVESQN